MKNRIDKLRYPAESILSYTGSIYKIAISDQQFKIKWLKVKQNRLTNQTKCAYCMHKWKKSSKPVLHHKLMFSKENELTQMRVEITIRLIAGEISRQEACSLYLALMNELIDYYKTLADTDLICSSCHAKEHSNITGKRRTNQKLKI